MLKNKQSRTIFLMFRNLITDCFTQEIERDRQNGFIPMLVIFLLIIAAVIYLAFTQVMHHQK
jgi:hypothetical protein